MMNRLENAARQALENSQPSFLAPEWRLVRNEDITALREALAEQATEPDWKSEATALRVNEQNLEAKLAQPKDLEHDEHAPACSPEEFQLRGVLATSLKCWHRLTEAEAQNLMEFVRGIGQQAAELKVCKGIPRKGCDYLATCDTVCNKCGQVHHHHQMVAIATAPTQQPLTPREVELIDGMIEVQMHHAAQCDAIANRTMADKQKKWDMERVELLRKLKAAHGVDGSKT